jgi:hypothetical protein
MGYPELALPPGVLPPFDQLMRQKLVEKVIGGSYRNRY